ncbi:glycosyltransferase [Engelhardtia mirabilis]|uniref:GDP-mannose-dependent alpha-(1-6)-phosphatidylinositol monomannoside mannosyltransferase n=1 Tax=Engelhardtia mirabilis TaxID=2528011 RepID=A0A518BIA6_9BACT|nr:GDP-mannose-dependent alpha-(1-6)-phosphatidylinositol monomannoside mannosyltransferase [Planctomycetes bacterium Pla133]QDV01021.1 GDP-mannose-dependent alpha-(1-6)-phosphatidylinositol monomannoside mannosyltransferase [Planctomycetes bacterium Pla86]
MRILFVSHNFLPKHPAGTEIYTFQCGRALAERGHEVHVFTTEKDIGRKHLTVNVREYEGLPVHELVNNLFYKDFRSTWDNPAIARTFADFLDDLKPDVVHFMHLMYLSVGCLEEAAKRAPVFYTLHDYWLQCARFGQRVHADRSICHTIDTDRCGRCMVDFKFRQSDTQRRMAKVIAAVNGATGIDLGPAARRFEARLQPSKGALEQAPPGSLRMPDGTEQAPVAAEPLTPEEQVMADSIRERDEALRARILPAVTRFIAPSRFLRGSFVEWGIPEQQILHMRTGIDLRRFEGLERRRGEKLRVGFIGTIVPHKGLHVLLQAWQQLPADLRAKAELAVYGPTEHNPPYVRAVRELATSMGVPLRGRLKAGDVAEILRGVDLLVVPSVWYENSPLIILEALATRTPLMVSNLGGMAELVEPEVTGFRFEVGDPRDLGHRLRLILEEPGQLEALYPDHKQIRSAEDDAEALEELYGAALRGTVDQVVIGGPG